MNVRGETELSRKARKQSVTGIYHIMIRGVDCRIFSVDDQDCVTFLSIPQKVKEKTHS